jgi:hypothetical protein
MAAVRVFVDDAVLGRFPPVCAKTGMPSDGRLAVTTTVGGSGRVSAPWLILLVLLGPIGWVALAVLAVALPTGPNGSPSRCRGRQRPTSGCGPPAPDGR